MKKIIASIAASALAGSAAFAGVSATANGSNLYEITDPIVGDVVLDNTKEYLLTEIVFVESGSSLTIPSGTVIRGVIGQLTQDESAIENEPGTLVIARGAQIDESARGSADSGKSKTRWADLFKNIILPA